MLIVLYYYQLGEKKMLPIGIENFEEIRTDEFYYVDKTAMIRDLLRRRGKVNLFTRPRRFGKSLNMSMLKYFLRLTVILDCLMVWISRRKKCCVKNTWGNIRLFQSV